MRIGLNAALIIATAFVVPHQVRGDEFFEKKVRPLLIKRCYKCHSGTKTGGGLSLDTAAGWRKGGESGPAIVPGKPDQSLLIQAINYRDLQMPPKDKGGPLSKPEIAVLTKWVAAGARDPRISAEKTEQMRREAARKWWSFQPIRHAAKANEPDAIDGFINKKLAKNGLNPAAAADKRTLIRRATYDLTGLPPTQTEVDAFLNDDSPGAFDKVIDRLLASRQYGVRWGRHWLDVVRYADTAGENTDRPLPHAWRYRNWVFDSFNRDTPFDRFVQLQLAGDIITETSKDSKEISEGIIATGYLAVARRFGHDIDKDIHLMHEDVIDNVGKNFLGLTLGCARCHDHKYDPFTSQDYYALYGIFNSSKFSFPGCEPKGQPRDLVSLFSKAETDRLMGDYRKRLAEFEKGPAAAAKETARLKDVAAKNNRLLANDLIAEGKSVSLHEKRKGALDRIQVKRGEVLQLAVLPNGNHGADTTRVEWEIEQLDGKKTKWNVADLISVLVNGGPIIEDKGAHWCFLEVTNGPRYLSEKKKGISGQPNLNAWAFGDTPSVTVNASDKSVKVWTTLPAKTFYVHPGPGRTVAVAWVCPQDGTYQVRGMVADGHPAPGLDGVSFRFEHFSAAAFGEGLVALSKLVPGGPKPTPPAIPVAYGVVESKPQNARVHERGDPEQLGTEVPRRWLSVFGGDLVSAGSGRKQLGQWIVRHPLFARVVANRVWQWHFGRGLVATPNDFGSRGAAVSHEELLDWLASQFKAHGYRIKPLHRLIMKSAAYRRSSAATAEVASRDPENIWLARYSRRRLSAEEIRDSLLQASGKLDLTLGTKHPFPPESSWRFTQHAPFTAVYDTMRRSAFMMVQRQRRHPYLALFDGADPNASTPIRQATIVPTQALYFLNNPFFHQRAEEVAAALDAPQTEARIQQAIRKIFQRDPTSTDLEIAQRLLQSYPGDAKQKWNAYCRVLLASNEFLFVD